MNDKNQNSIKSFYENQSLSPDKLRQLQTMADLPRRRHTGRWTSIAAGLAILTITASLFFRVESPAMLSLRVAEEVALNHNKQLAMDFRGDNIKQLAAKMPKLDFSLQLSERIGPRGLRVEGTRYCSIQGKIAAQIRLLNGEGESLTLYQTRHQGDLVRLGENTHQLAQLRIEQWQEQGYFYALAQQRQD